MSGHSKWHTIKHKKGALDAKRGKIFTKMIKEITVATKTGGSGDPDSNARLRKAISDAKAQNMPNDTIDRAIKRNMGEWGSVGWMFDKKGYIVVDKAAKSEEELFEIAVGAGADDMQDDGDLF